MPLLAISSRGFAMVGAGERPLFRIPEEFGFEERVGQRRAVDPLELVRSGRRFNS